MDTNFVPFRNFSHKNQWNPGDVLALFGELFQRGYANGLVEDAESKGLTIVRGTVGRRDKDSLRALTDSELASQTSPFINVPLEAGFDLEKDAHGQSPVDQIKDIKLSQWAEASLDWKSVEDSRQKAILRFKSQIKTYINHLEAHIAPGRKFLLAHLMAGGVPRAKIIMPLMNRVFKGMEDRYLDSTQFWNSELGKLCQQNFVEVTAETFKYLLEETSDFRSKVQKAGGEVCYLAYGYHGTEIIIDGKLQWQTYTPYLQGWAKMKLEDIAKKYHAMKVNCSVYNCPEILTNSSSIFQGVELSLYPLLESLRMDAPNLATSVSQECMNLLKNPLDMDKISSIIKKYYSEPEIVALNKDFSHWPRHSTKSHMETMLKCSDELIELHKSPKELMTAPLSEVVFKSCGSIMLQESLRPLHPVYWIGHDAVSKYYPKY